MKTPLPLWALLSSLLVLAACDKPVVINTPPSTVPGPAGPTGATGTPGAPGNGGTTVIVTPPAASAPSN